MATLFRTAFLPVSPDKAWQRIAAVEKVHEILPAIVACAVDGDRRSCTFADGGVLQERLISVDAELRRVAYTITDSPFALEHHSASMQITPEGDGARVTWTTDLKPDAMKEALAPMFDTLFQDMTQRLAAT